MWKNPRCVTVKFILNCYNLDLLLQLRGILIVLLKDLIALLSKELTEGHWTLMYVFVCVILSVLCVSIFTEWESSEDISWYGFDITFGNTHSMWASSTVTRRKG